MNEYDIIMEMLSRHNSGKLKLTDQEANLLAMQAQRLGEDFRVESKPISKGLFDAVDMATFGLLPNQWRPTSQGQDVFGESGLDRFAGGVGSVAGLATGIGGAVKGLGMAGRAITARGGIKGAVASAKEAQSVKRANAYARSLYNKGENIVGAGIGRAAGYGSRAAEFAAQSPGLQTAGNVARGLGSSAAALGRAGYGRLPGAVRQYTSPALRRGRDFLRNPAGINVGYGQGLGNIDPWLLASNRGPLGLGMGVQQGGYIAPKGYQEGNYVEPDIMDTVTVQAPRLNMGEVSERQRRRHMTEMMQRQAGPARTGGPALQGIFGPQGGQSTADWQKELMNRKAAMTPPSEGRGLARRPEDPSRRSMRKEMMDKYIESQKGSQGPWGG